MGSKGNGWLGGWCGTGLGGAILCMTLRILWQVLVIQDRRERHSGASCQISIFLRDYFPCNFFFNANLTVLILFA